MAQPEAWEHLVDHDPGKRRYELLRRDDEVEVWLICWMHDHDTGFHDHDLSEGAVGVVAGAVREDRLVLGGGTVSREVAAGGTFTFSASDIHRVLHAGDGAGRHHPRVLPAAVADGRLRGAGDRRAAPALRVLRGGAAPAHARRSMSVVTTAS